jgi:hypothetical protein
MSGSSDEVLFEFQKIRSRIVGSVLEGSPVN